LLQRTRNCKIGKVRGRATQHWEGLNKSIKKTDLGRGRKGKGGCWLISEEERSERDGRFGGETAHYCVWPGGQSVSSVLSEMRGAQGVPRKLQSRRRVVEKNTQSGREGDSKLPRAKQRNEKTRTGETSQRQKGDWCEKKGGKA